MTLPQFPEMKRLELADRDAIQRHTEQYPPYSDFNFISMYSWDTHSTILVSELNGNLVVRFADYQTGEPFYMFLGDCAVDDTARTLLSQSRREELEPALKLIPEWSALLLNPKMFSVSHEPDHMDYVEHVERLHTYSGRRFAGQRNGVNRFRRDNPHARFEILDLRSVAVREQLMALFDEWSAQRRAGADGHERAAFARCVEQCWGHLLGTGIVHLSGRLIAVTVHECVGNGFAVNHFEKALATEFRGVSAFLTQRTAHVLAELGVRHINIEQDLGIRGLRMNKRSYAPCDGLRKYRISEYAR
ncbi:MAG: DUF2156 domain-containing protein [Alphaproteobacteria bacterium]|nr:DUF2156 domain-containing protein [Alphaproteobacteria bacterium]